MIGTIALFILLASIFGIGFIAFKKLPELSSLSFEQTGQDKGAIARFKEKIKNKVSDKATSSGEAILLKTLSKVRVFSLKIEHKSASWLNVLRQKSIEKKKSFSDNYWEKIKSKRKGKKPKAEEDIEDIQSKTK